MAINTETPVPAVEAPKTLETLRDRTEAIDVVNRVHSLMQGVAQDLKTRPERSKDQNKQIIDAQIVKDGRALLMGADVPLTEDMPLDRFTNEFTDSKTQTKFKVEEGLPAETYEDFLKGQIHDTQVLINAETNPVTREDLERVLADRQYLLGVIDKISTPYQPKSDEEKEARIEQEAYWIHSDPLRDTFSRENDWYNATNIIGGRKFINLPPRLTINPSLERVAPPIYTYDKKTGQRIDLPLPDDFGQDRITDAYTQGYKLRNMPNRLKVTTDDMPEEDGGVEGDRTRDAIEGKQRRMPGRAGINMEEMPKEDATDSLEGDQRTPDFRDIITDAYTNETDNADRIVNGYGFDTVGNQVDRRGEKFGGGEPLPRDNGSAFSELGKFDIPEDKKIIDAYGLKTEKTPKLPKDTGRKMPARSLTGADEMPSQDQRTNRARDIFEALKRRLPSRTRTNDDEMPAEDVTTRGERRRLSDGEERKNRLRFVPPVIIGLLPLIAAVLLLQDKGNSLNVPPSTGGISTPGEPFGPEPFIGPSYVEPSVNLTGHLYTNQPDASGSYGSLYGHEVYELAKVLDPTLKPQIGESADFDRIEEVVNQFAQNNPDQFQKIVDTYTNRVIGNNPPGTIRGEDAIVRADFQSVPMQDVYKQVMAEKGGA